jgi:hypothetical protein
MNELDNLLPTLDLESIVNTVEEDVIEETIIKESQDIDNDLTDKTIELPADADPSAVSFYEELKSRGYINQESFDGKWETLDNYLENFPQQVLETVVQSLPDVSKDVMKFIATAGQNITKDELKNFFTTYFENTEVSLETLDDTRNYLEKVYTEQGLTKRAVQAMLDDLEDEDKLESTAKTFLEKEKSKTTNLIENKQEQNAEIKRKEVERISQINTEIEQTGWKQETKDRVKQVINSNMNDTLREIVLSPKALVQFANLLSIYDKNKKEFNFETFVKQLESKQTSSLKDRIEKNMFSSSTVNTKMSSKNPNSNPNENLVPII